MIRYRLALLGFSLLLLNACKKNDDSPDTAGASESGDRALVLPETPYNYSIIDLPNHFNAPPVAAQDNTPADNPVTDHGATLGRVLFYDVNLSANRSISCASCHDQAHGFSDPLMFSLGFEGGETGRNSMGLSNARFYTNGHFFWDERAQTLEDQVLMPIQDEVEMGMTLEALVSRLDSLEYYPELFELAFGEPEITTDHIARALAQFVRSMDSYQSKYDAGAATIQGPPGPATTFPNFTAQENQGMNLFFTSGCAACHSTELQTATEAINNGLDLTTTDPGLGAVSGLSEDEGKFKVPSLRNIARTGPFMHDGRFATLAEVVEHYNNGIQNHPNLDTRLKVGPNPRVLNLDQGEKDALVAFMHTLTDAAFLSDVKFSDPFTEP